MEVICKNLFLEVQKDLRSEIPSSWAPLIVGLKLQSSRVGVDKPSLKAQTIERLTNLQGFEAFKRSANRTCSTRKLCKEGMIANLTSQRLLASPLAWGSQK